MYVRVSRRAHDTRHAAITTNLQDRTHCTTLGVDSPTTDRLSAIRVRTLSVEGVNVNVREVHYLERLPPARWRPARLGFRRWEM